MSSPSTNVAILFGRSGASPVGLGRWWTSSPRWLHGSALHILFNMMSAGTSFPPWPTLRSRPHSDPLDHRLGCGFLAGSSGARLLPLHTLPPGCASSPWAPPPASSASSAPSLTTAAVEPPHQGAGRGLGLSGIVMGFLIPASITGRTSAASWVGSWVEMAQPLPAREGRSHPDRRGLPPRFARGGGALRRHRRSFPEVVLGSRSRGTEGAAVRPSGEGADAPFCLFGPSPGRP